MAEDTLNNRKSIEEIEAAVIRFSGDSGDGMQLVGLQFTDTTALFGNDLNTFPDYPSEIRAPAGTIAGVSGFQVHFGSRQVFTPGDQYDVLVAMNAAALKVDLPKLKKGGIIIANADGFDAKNLRLAKYPENISNLEALKNMESLGLQNYIVHFVEVTKHTKDALAGLGLGVKEIERSKNMFVLGLLFWMYNRPLDNTLGFINKKFSRKPEIADANIRALKAGWNFGENTELFISQYNVAAADLPMGNYRNITGNHAVALGLLAASEKSGLPLFLGSYPITPASDILHELSKYKYNGIKTVQAEDEIAGICSAIGASFGGNLAVTTTSGPGMSLKTEALGYACMVELPLVICNVQRGGPSTGLPTKTEQSDLLQAMYGRHGEAPLPVLAATSPSDCFEMAYAACKLALEHVTPVILLTDGYLANGSEPWKYPDERQLADIRVEFAELKDFENGEYLPYRRNEKLARGWAKPGTPGLMHRLGGLEKQNESGNVSYDPKNHEFMVKMRAAKVEKMAQYIPWQDIDNGDDDAEVLVLGWGSTYGVIKTAVKELIEEKYNVAHIHLKYINPFPRNLGELLYNFKKIIVPEMNNGQLIKIIRDKYLVPAIGFSKIQGLPFYTHEIKEKVIDLF